MTSTAAAIIPAAGFGTRMKLDHPKQYHLLAGEPILVHTVRAFAENSHINTLVVVVPERRLAESRDLMTRYGVKHPRLRFTAGGRRRQDSVKAGMALLDDEIGGVGAGWGVLRPGQGPGVGPSPAEGPDGLAVELA
ncbi:MAG: IspD/TarI family cytidylyltransferase, partial [Desulforhopalus sp.]